MSGRGDVGLGGGDGGMGVRPQPWRVPWWRSVGFWLGLWVLAFLVWVWVDSFSNLWTMRSRGWVMYQGHSAGEISWGVMLSQGKMAYLRTGVHEAPAGIVTFSRPVSFHHGSGVALDTTSAWGTDSSVNVLRSAPERLSLKATKYWCPFAVVVAGYVALWVGALALWRRWMMRRWRAAQGDGEWMEGEVVVAGEQSNRI